MSKAGKFAHARPKQAILATRPVNQSKVLQDRIKRLAEMAVDPKRVLSQDKEGNGLTWLWRDGRYWHPKKRPDHPVAIPSSQMTKDLRDRENNPLRNRWPSKYRTLLEGKCK